MYMRQYPYQYMTKPNNGTLARSYCFSPRQYKSEITDVVSPCLYYYIVSTKIWTLSNFVFTSQVLNLRKVCSCNKTKKQVQQRCDIHVNDFGLSLEHNPHTWQTFQSWFFFLALYCFFFGLLKKGLLVLMNFIRDTYYDCGCQLVFSCVQKCSNTAFIHNLCFLIHAPTSNKIPDDSVMENTHIFKGY